MPSAPDAPTGKELLEVRSRVAIVDTDASGLIYYGAPYRWAEAVFSAWWAEIGHPLGAMFQTGWASPCVHSEAEYRGALVADDPLRLSLRTGHVGRTSFGFDVWIYRGDEDTPRVVTRSRHVHGKMSAVGDPTAGFSPQPLPGWLVEALS